MRWILKKIIEAFGYVLVRDDMETIPDLSKWVMLSLNSIEGYFGIDYKYAFPQVNVRDFMSTMRQFGIVVIIDEKLKQASFRLVRDLINTPQVSHLLN